MEFVTFGHSNINVDNLHGQWCFLWKHFVVISTKITGGGLGRFCLYTVNLTNFSFCWKISLNLQDQKIEK
jgi:hypothetical protein